MQLCDTYRKALRHSLAFLIKGWAVGVTYSTSQVVDQLQIDYEKEFPASPYRSIREMRNALHKRTRECLIELANVAEEYRIVKQHKMKTELKTPYNLWSANR